MLYRFDKEEKGWKTRGKGNVKLMQHQETKKIRVLLREDKTLKLRMNHTVVPGVELKPNQGSEKSWTWATTDYALEAPSEETFAIKFRTEEAAREFKVKHDEARKINAGGAAVAATVPEEKEAEEPAGNAFSALKDPTKWECAQCLVENAAGLAKCAACESPNPNAPAAEPEAAAAAGGTGGFTFGGGAASAPSPFSFGGDGASTASAFGSDSAPAAVFGSGSAFGAASFGDGASSAFGGGATFGDGGAANPFAPKPAAEEPKPAAEAPATPEKAAGAAAEKATPSSSKKDDSAAVEEECDAEYAPVVVLQEVETDSGEGKEDCFYQG